MVIFADVYRKRVQTKKKISKESEKISDISIQKIGKDLRFMLGQIIEAKVNINILKQRLEV
jgi:type IV secretory pathway VirB9-like protein